MKTLDIILKTHESFSKAVGGNYLSACNKLKKALDSDNTIENIKPIVVAHYEQSVAVGGNFEALLDALKNYTE